MSQSVAYTISYNISQALRGLKNLQRALAQVGSVTEQTQQAVQGASQMSKIDLQAWSGAFAQLGGMAKGMFDSIVSASPSMSVAFAQMSFAVDMMWLSIGENLAPVINETLVPAIEGLTSWIEQLSPQMQQWIGLTIGLTVAASALAIGIIAIQTAGAPLIAIILGITIAIAGLIVLWQNDFLGMKTLTLEMFGAIQGSLGETMGKLGGLGEAFSALFELVRPALEIFVTIFIARIQMMVENFIAYINLIVTVFTEIINIIVAIAQGDWAQVWESMGNIVQAFIEYFKTIFQNFIGFIDTILEALFGIDLNELGGVILESVKQALNVVINWINSTLLQWLDDTIQEASNLVGKIPGVDNPGWSFDWRIPTFQEGGFMPFTGLAFLHEGERVLNPAETQAFTQLQQLGIPAGTGGGGGGGTTQEFNISITLDTSGFIFLESSRQMDELTDMISEKIVERLQRSSSLL